MLGKTAPGKSDLPEAELERRRLAWVEEYGARSARKLYSLQQQARSIQADITRQQPNPLQGPAKVDKALMG